MKIIYMHNAKETVLVRVSKVKGTWALRNLNNSFFLCIGKSSLGVANSSEAVRK